MNIKKRALIQYVVNKNNNIPVYRTPEFADDLSGMDLKSLYKESDLKLKKSNQCGCSFFMHKKNPTFNLKVGERELK